MLTTDREVKFIPFNNAGNECHAVVYLIDKNNKKLDIGRALVGLGFARAAPITKEIDLKVDKGFEHYQKQLKASEARAKSLRKGCWSDVPELWLRWKIRTTTEKLLFQLKPTNKKVPALVR